MASTKQRQAARKNIRKAITAAKRKRTIAHMPRTRTALSKQAAAVRQRKRTGAKSPKTRNELMKIAARRGLRGRSKMGRAQLARKLGQR